MKTKVSQKIACVAAWRSSVLGDALGRRRILVGRNDLPALERSVNVMELTLSKKQRAHIERTFAHHECLRSKLALLQRVSVATPMTTTVRCAVDDHVALIAVSRLEAPKFAKRRDCLAYPERVIRLCPFS
jgi:hypothetical protein